VRVVSHTCSNTEIVCALGGAELLVGVDADSDFPADAVAALPKLGRDLELDVEQVRALKPDLVLTSLTVPGHEKIVAALDDAGMQTLVCDPQSLDDVYADIRRIAIAIGAPGRGDELVASMVEAMPPLPRYAPPFAPSGRFRSSRVARCSRVSREGRDSGRSDKIPKVLIEWWPKPVIAPAKRSWATDVLALAGGVNPWAGIDAKSTTLTDAQILDAAPDAVVMSWCGVRLENYRRDIVRRRPGWQNVPAVRDDRIVPITEAWLGRPGPRLVEGYRALAKLVAELTPAVA
jgi:iron complex transport system substrate-binding protein